MNKTIVDNTDKLLTKMCKKLGTLTSQGLIFLRIDVLEARAPLLLVPVMKCRNDFNDDEEDHRIHLTVAMPMNICFTQATNISKVSDRIISAT